MKSHRSSGPGALQRLLPAAFVFLSAIVTGGVGYWLIGGGRWPLDECLYMAIVTLSTVGFAETLPDLHAVPFAREWTVTLILLGSGTLLYFASTFTAILVEGELQGFFRRNKMNRSLEQISEHVIVCGVGANGLHVALELAEGGTPLVVIEQNLEKIERLQETLPDVLYVLDDATDDQALIDAGIMRAKGIIAALTDDKSNLYVTIAARALNDGLRIVSKCVEDSARGKLERAGADVIVSPSLIGGHRMASEMLRPTVVRFLDDMLRDRGSDRKIEEVAVPEGSRLQGSSLSRANFRQFGDALVVAIRGIDGQHTYNPPADHRLEPGQVLIVMAPARSMSDLRKFIGA